MHGVGESTGALLSFLYLFRHYLKFPKCNISEKVVSTSLASYTIHHVTLAEFLYAALTIMVICYKLNSITIIIVSCDTTKMLLKIYFIDDLSNKSEVAY